MQIRHVSDTGLNKEIAGLFKNDSKCKEISILLDQLVNSISSHNPSNAVALLKLWRYNEKCKNSIFK